MWYGELLAVRVQYVLSMCIVPDFVCFYSKYRQTLLQIAPFMDTFMKPHLKSHSSPVSPSSHFIGQFLLDIFCLLRVSGHGNFHCTCIWVGADKSNCDFYSSCIRQVQNNLLLQTITSLGGMKFTQFIILLASCCKLFADIEGTCHTLHMYLHAIHCWVEINKYSQKKIVIS